MSFFALISSADVESAELTLQTIINLKFGRLKFGIVSQSNLACKYSCKFKYRIRIADVKWKMRWKKMWVMKD